MPRPTTIVTLTIPNGSSQSSVADITGKKVVAYRLHAHSSLIGANVEVSYNSSNWFISAAGPVSPSPQSFDVWYTAAPEESLPWDCYYRLNTFAGNVTADVIIDLIVI